MLSLQHSKAGKSERRRFARISERLAGRFMLPDQTEHLCVSDNVSPGDIFLEAASIPPVGTQIVAYLDQLGRIEGRVARITPTGFAMTTNATEAKRDKLASQLMWLSCRELGTADDRRHDRIVPRLAITEMTTGCGSRHTVRLLDISCSGAAFSTTVALKMGDLIMLGQTRARVVRQIEGGFGVELLTQIPPEKLSPDTVL